MKFPKSELAACVVAVVACTGFMLPVISCTHPGEQPPVAERPINGDAQQILAELRAQGGHFADVAKILQGLEAQIIKLNEATAQLRQRSRMERPMLRAVLAVEALLLVGIIALFWAFRRLPLRSTSQAT